VQPNERTKAGFLARARALRDQAVREGDQGYVALLVLNGKIVGEGQNYVVLDGDPTAHAALLAVCGTSAQVARSLRPRRSQQIVLMTLRAIPPAYRDPGMCPPLAWLHPAR
jgi:tRNA(Arg) A34 adenosine deaminase TadA